MIAGGLQSTCIHYVYSVLSCLSLPSPAFCSFIAIDEAQNGMNQIRSMILWLTIAVETGMYRFIHYTRLTFTAKRLGYPSFMHCLLLECLQEQPTMDRSTRLYVQYLKDDVIVYRTIYC